MTSRNPSGVEHERHLGDIHIADIDIPMVKVAEYENLENRDNIHKNGDVMDRNCHRWAWLLVMAVVYMDQIENLKFPAS